MFVLTTVSFVVTAVVAVALFVAVQPVWDARPDSPALFRRSAIDDLDEKNAAAIAEGRVNDVAFFTAVRGYDRAAVDTLIAETAADGEVPTPLKLPVASRGYRMDQVDRVIGLITGVQPVSAGVDPA